MIIYIYTHYIYIYKYKMFPIICQSSNGEFGKGMANRSHSVFSVQPTITHTLFRVERTFFPDVNCLQTLQIQ